MRVLCFLRRREGKFLERETRLPFKLKESFRLIDRMKVLPDKIFNEAYLKRIAIEDEGRDRFVSEQPARFEPA